MCLCLTDKFGCVKRIRVLYFNGIPSASTVRGEDVITCESLYLSGRDIVSLLNQELLNVVKYSLETVCNIDDLKAEIVQKTGRRVLFGGSKHSFVEVDGIKYNLYNLSVYEEGEAPYSYKISEDLSEDESSKLLSLVNKSYEK